MKNLLVLIILVVAYQAIAESRLKIIEIKTNDVFVISRGFDNNDNAQIVITGSLPNICYNALAPEIEINSRNKKIAITQKAALNSLSTCADDSSQLPEYLNHPVSFTHEVSLGQLAAGTYTVSYYSNPTDLKHKRFTIDQAHLDSIDNSLYAHVTSAFIPEMVHPTKNGILILTGVINSNCMLLTNENIKVERQDNVIIVQPVLKLNQNTGCSYSPYPLYQVVSLGTLTQGTYLIHVRSMSGKSVNRTVTVSGPTDMDLSGF